jgi:hypothetical protein
MLAVLAAHIRLDVVGVLLTVDQVRWVIGIWIVYDRASFTVSLACGQRWVVIEMQISRGAVEQASQHCQAVCQQHPIRHRRMFFMLPSKLPCGNLAAHGKRDVRAVQSHAALPPFLTNSVRVTPIIFAASSRTAFLLA